MSENTDVYAEAEGRAGAQEREQAEPEAVLDEDLLVEEISIDGMCGVY